MTCLRLSSGLDETLAVMVIAPCVLSVFANYYVYDGCIHVCSNACMASVMASVSSLCVVTYVQLMRFFMLSPIAMRVSEVIAGPDFVPACNRRTPAPGSHGARTNGRGNEGPEGGPDVHPVR